MAVTLPPPGLYRRHDGQMVLLRMIALWEGTVDLWVCIYQDQKTGAHHALDAMEWSILMPTEDGKQTPHFELMR